MAESSSPSNQQSGGRQRRRVARASGKTVAIAIDRALAELDFAPGELADDQYEVKILVAPEEGFMGVGGVEAEIELTLLVDEDDYFGPSREQEDIEDYELEEEVLELQPEAGSARLRLLLAEVLGHIGLEAKIHIVERPETVSADITGEDLGILIGKRGQTLDALEYLASIILYPDPRARKQVELDVEGYKERRRRNVERMALHHAREAVRKGKPVELEPMTPAERKIVHLSLKDRRDVITESKGREPKRAVIITPTRSAGPEQPSGRG